MLSTKNVDYLRLVCKKCKRATDFRLHELELIGRNCECGKLRFTPLEKERIGALAKALAEINPNFPASVDVQLITRQDYSNNSASG